VEVVWREVTQRKERRAESALRAEVVGGPQQSGAVRHEDRQGRHTVTDLAGGPQQGLQCVMKINTVDTPSQTLPEDLSRDRSAS